jgi:hypothetical protein
VLGGLVLAALLLGGFWAAILFVRQPSVSASVPDPAITVVLAPTLTPVITMPVQVASETPTTAPDQGGIPTQAAPISVGMYVQINGTGGSGLRLREQPGTSTKALFLGMESEVYLVQDGPQQKDGFTWYYLVAPYDKNRSGWAASNYLLVVQKPAS